MYRDLDVAEQPCEWTDQDEEFYETACGNTFVFLAGAVGEGDFDFCPYCGRAIKTKE